MGRKVSIGVVGSGGGLGTIVASGTGNTLTTAVTNQNLIIDPNGTGITQIIGATQLNAQSELRLADTDSSNYIALRAAGTISSNYTITWPAATAAANGYVLTSQTDGTLAWSAIPATGVTAADPGSTATVHYPIFETNAGSIPTGSLTTAKVRSNLSFVPSTGVLTATAFSGNVTSTSVTVTGGTINNTIIGGTTRAAGSFAALTATTITEDSSITLKENINPIENALENILKLSGVTYDRIDTKEHEAGLIAEWVELVIPDLVTKDSSGKPIGIKYTKLTAYLIESIKELKQQVDSLKGR
jgi:hypothetical protein